MRRQVDYWLVAILALSALLNGWHLSWGLPNGNDSWAADAIGPVTALSVARHTFGSWNSGWFYFKYAPGWPFLMVLASAPYLALLFATGGWRHPVTEYPYGFANPERALFVMAMIGRLLNVGFAVATAAVAYGIGDRLVGRAAARWSAFLVATAYPIVYYAHTTNLDISYCFWLLLALYCAIVAAGTDERLPWIGLGVSAGMALATKEQGFAFLLPLPCAALAARARVAGSARVCWQPSTLWMAGTGVVTLLLFNNAVINPLGFVSRLAYLVGHPIGHVDARLLSVQFSVWKGAQELVYLAHLWDGLSSSFGIPLLVLAGIGVLAVLRRPPAAFWLLVPALALYYLALRGMALITLRYLLPIIAVGAILIGALLGDVWTAARRTRARWPVGTVLAAIAALALGRAIDLDRLLVTDSRYQAEHWMAANLPSKAHAEVYQTPAFLPRFRDGVTAEFIPLDQRSRDAVVSRLPDAIIVNSASRKSVTHSWAADWRQTGSLLVPSPPAVEFLQALEGGQLPYRVGGTFRQEPYLLRNRITSVAPEITIYVRNQ